MIHHQASPISSMMVEEEQDIPKGRLN
jgi:hypothetical protein